jgi:hypothetical protein
MLVVVMVREAIQQNPAFYGTQKGPVSKRTTGLCLQTDTQLCGAEPGGGTGMGVPTGEGTGVIGAEGNVVVAGVAV